MTRPIQFPEWATNDDYATGVDTGTPTKVEPPSGYKDDGYRGEDAFWGQYVNWLEGLQNDWVKWLDSGSYVEVDLSSLTAADGIVDGTTVRTLYGAPWTYVAASPFTVSPFWVKAATGMGVGQWIHNSLVDVHLGRSVALGPTPNETFPTATPAARINKACIDHGFFTNDADDTHNQYTTTSATIVTLADLSNLGTLAQSDIIQFSINAVASVTGGAPLNFNVAAEISVDGGSTYTAMTGNGGALEYHAATNNNCQALALNFLKVLFSAPTGDVKIRLRGYSNGTNTLVVDVDSWYALVSRP